LQDDKKLYMTFLTTESVINC